MKHYFFIFALLSYSFIAGAQTDEHKVAILQELAHNNEIKAQFQLAEHYAAGLHTEQRLDKAFYWYQKAAEQGHLASMFSLATAYDLGEGTKQDYQQALHWYQQAALQGEASAAYNVGIFYDEGVGIKKDTIQASTWLRLANLLEHELADDALRHTSAMLSKETKQAIEEKAQSLYQQIQQNINSKQ